MQDTADIKAAGSDKPRRLFAFNGGFFLQKRLRRILFLAGYDLRLGRPTPEDLIAIWGNSPTAHRGLKAAEKTGASKLFVEDAFLRSLFPGRVAKEPPIGLLIDGICPHFDPSQPSDLENLLKHHALDDTVLLDRARGGIARLRETHLTKYAAVDLESPLPAPGYVLVIDQTRNDAAVRASNANEARFQEMLVLAQEENPGAPVLIKTHPETQAGSRAGYYGPEHETERVTLCTSAHSPWSLLEGAVAVYTVSSQMGFEAILAGHKPRVFGQPFYAGWDLTQDEFPLYRRQRRLTRAQLFAAAMILYPTWYDSCRDQLCDFEVALEQMAAQTRAWHEDRKGWNAFGMRLWKRKPLQKFFGQHAPMTFDRKGKSGSNMVWANKPGPSGAVKLEDGFLRSRGLGAALVPPLSLVCDDLGIYYDPSQESRLEHWIAKRETLRIDQERRALALCSALRKSRVSKYNLLGNTPDLPSGHLILVPGQVEDDASILKGTSEIKTNLALLRATRAANPTARILFKPHPDVEAGLRQGAVDRNEAEALADMVLEQADMGYLLDHVDEIWTMTSLTGFEALLRGCKVTTFGAPFYAGWGLTEDLGTPPARRRARPNLTGLIHATLIDYPRYHDPVSGLACTPELIIERLQAGDIPHPGLGNRLLSKLQGQFSSYHHLWRR
ncbi:capsular polysaccharide biosynthesis protein [Shimia marina]|uniref:Capsule polysaccharide biosynthesis protein n=1 Tax=Shimia marina TaxID=321267 RepID=A0A0P1ERV5_9RHOB|nr:capsular polysaccharide biosynthesis protein [Shimia marina]CUH53251.1 Capsule polysaccharide biosynthesis protein [Shimia marina]SFD81516.1 capsular polysaccharide export protein [Shimia marina]